MILYNHVRIVITMYADDTVIFGKDATDFQINLGVFYDYVKMMEDRH